MKNKFENGSPMREAGITKGEAGAGLLAVAIILGAFGLNSKIFEDRKKYTERLNRSRVVPIEQIDNKCAENIFTIGELKLRAPGR